MKDQILIAEAMDGKVRIHACVSTTMVETARAAHDMYPTSCAALGRVMTATALMCSDLKKPQEKISVLLNGHGPIGNIQVQGNGNCEIRGYVDNPQVYIFRNSDGKLDVGQAVGKNGTMTITKDLGLKEPFTGIVNLRSGEIGDDFAYYFAVSEQTPSVVAVGVLVAEDYSVKAAGGILLQLMPDADEETISAVEKIANSMRPVSTSIDMGMSPEEMILEILPDAKILSTKDLCFHCSCSKEHFKDALALIHANEIQAMIDEDHGCETVCQYCGKAYNFSEEDLKEVLEKHENVEHRKHLD